MMTDDLAPYHRRRVRAAGQVTLHLGIGPLNHLWDGGME